MGQALLLGARHTLGAGAVCPEPDHGLRLTETTIRINGQVQGQFNTRHMLFDAASHIAKISRYSTLYPGDVVWLGAEGATPNMRPGDVVEIEISGIGTLRNYVVAEE